MILVFFFWGGGSLFSISIRVLTSVDITFFDFLWSVIVRACCILVCSFCKNIHTNNGIKPLRKNTNNFKTESAAKLTFDFWTKYHGVRKIWVAYFMNNLKVFDYGRRLIPFSPLYVRIKLQCLNYVIHSIFVKNNLQIIG